MWRPTGVFIFNVWDRIETNELADEVTRAVGTLFPDDPPLFLPRTPHGYYDEAEIQADVDAGGFPAPASFETVDARSCAETAAVPAVAYCQGTPLRNEIEARGATRLEEATAAAAAAVGTRWGQRDIDAGIRGHVITATKSRRD